MSDAIGPGDWVECVRADPHATTGESPLVAGRLYRVRDALNAVGSQSGQLVPVVRLVGVQLRRGKLGIEAAWTIIRFRPIRSDITEIERLLTAPVPEELALA